MWAKLTDIISRVRLRVHALLAALVAALPVLLDQVNAAVAAADPITQIAWQSTHDIDRNHPLMLALAAVLQFSSAEIDNLMRQAALQT